MTRPSKVAHFESLPAPEPREPMMSVGDFGRRLGTSRDQIDRLLRAGMPAIDISVPRPGRRRKRSWRINPAEAIAWLAQRSGRE